MPSKIIKTLIITLALATIAHADNNATDAQANADTADQDAYRYKGHVTPLAEPAGPAAPQTQPEEWNRWLPFFAKRVVASGVKLPPPYHVAYSYFYGYQRLDMSELKASIGGNAPQSLDFVRFNTSKIYTQSNQGQIGAWLFPFLNVYGIFGNVRGHGDVPIEIDVGGIANLIGMPLPGLPDNISIPEQHANFDGVTYGAGFTLTGHYKKLFFSLPFTFMESDISMSDTKSRSINIAPRIGTSMRLGRFGSLIVFVGATYFHLDADVKGHFDIPLANIPGGTFRFNYDITQRAAGAWSGLAGVSWTPIRNINIILEKGYGYNRANIIASLFFRF